MLLIKPNLKFWLVLSIIFDGGNCAADRHAKPIASRSSYDSSSSNDPHPDLDQVYAAKSFGKRPEPASSTTIHSTDWSVLNVVNGYFESAHATWNRFTGFSSQSSSPSQRAYRNADDKVMFVNHTSIVAHMVNGIYLQSGLMEGTIPIDELVAELLNFGSVKVEDVVNFKADGITGLVSQLKTTRSELEGAGPGVIEIEQDVVKWNKMRSDYELIGDFKKLPREKAQFEEVTNFNTSLLKELDQFGDALTGLVKRLGDTETVALADLTDSDNKQDLENNVRILGGSAKKIESKKEVFDTTAKKFISEKTLIKGAETFKPLETVVYLANSRQSSTRTPFIGIKDDMINTISSNVDKVLKLVTSFTSAGSEIKSIDALAGRRSRSEAGKYIDAFTNRLSSLNQLSQDVRDPWLGKVLAMEGSKVNNLVEGFQPLFKAVDQMGRISSKLQPISSDAVHQSLLKFSPLRDVVSSLAFDSTKTKDVIEKYQACSEKQHLSFNETESFIKNVKLLEDLNNKIQDLMGTDVSELKKEIDAYIKTLPPVDDIQALADHINKNNADLNRLKQRIEEFKKPFDGINAKNIETVVIPAMKKTIEGSFFNYISKALDTEEEVQKCLRPLTDGEKLAGALEVIQMLRKLDTTQFESFSTAASTLSQVSGDLADVKSIPETMKSVAKGAAKAINKFSDSDKQSKIIGQSARSLQYAYALKKVEASIAQLKTDGSFIRDQIQKIQSLKERNALEAKWGDHGKEIGELEAALAKIKTFDSKLDVSKLETMADYGTPLQDLAEISDSKINVQNKLEALDALIATADPTTKPKLEKAKESLVGLSNLDLEFSSHKTEFENSPTAFKAFNEFMTDFLSKDNFEDEDDSVKWGLVGGGGSILLIVLIVAIVILVFLILRRRKLNRMVLQWVKDHCLQSTRNATDKMNEILGVIETGRKVVDDSMLMLLDIQRYRDKSMVELNYEKIVLLTGYHTNYHANFVKTQSGVVYIAAQGPLAEGSREKYDRETHETSFIKTVDTRDDFIYMAMLQKSDYIVCLCGDEDFADKKCHRYFASNANEKMELDRFTVATGAVEEIFNGKIKKRTLDVVDKQGAMANRRITHMQFVHWKNDSMPDGHDEAIGLLETVNKSKTPIIVHCSTGTGKTMAFIGLQYVFDLVLKKPDTSFMAAIQELTRIRWSAFNLSLQLAWLVLGVSRRLMKARKLKYPEYDSEMKVYTELLNDHEETLLMQEAQDNKRRHGGQESDVETEESVVQEHFVIDLDD